MPDRQREPGLGTCETLGAGHNLPHKGNIACINWKAAAPAKPMPPSRIKCGMCGDTKIQNGVPCPQCTLGTCEYGGIGTTCHDNPHPRYFNCINWEASAPAPVLTPSDYLDIVRQPPLNKPLDAILTQPNAEDIKEVWEYLRCHERSYKAKRYARKSWAYKMIEAIKEIEDQSDGG